MLKLSTEPTLYRIIAGVAPLRNVALVVRDYHFRCIDAALRPFRRHCKRPDSWVPREWLRQAIYKIDPTKSLNPDEWEWGWDESREYVKREYSERIGRLVKNSKANDPTRRTTHSVLHAAAK